MNAKRVYRLPFYLLVIALSLSSCRLLNRGNGVQENTPPAETQPTVATPSPTVGVEALSFQTGRNDYTVTVDNAPREFIVYVPGGYDANQPTPVVFMFHGSNQSGNLMYENTKWVNRAEAENIIVVFPTAWKYPLIGEGGKHEKWNDITLFVLAEPNTELKDDVKFTKTMLAQVEATFNVDVKRIYATGFSNGGSFVSTRLLPEMNDVFAAFAISGSGTKLGNEQISANLPTNIAASLYSIIGTNDEKIAEGTSKPRPFPLDTNAILNDDLFGTMLTNTASLLGLDPAKYEVKSESGYTAFTYNQSTLGADNEYIFLMINNMGHVYPSVDNNRYQIDAAELFWEFFVRHPKS
jgi:poly(3-hydroxybutyrate) depolymerase